MAAVLKIKRGLTSTIAPAEALSSGELAYSMGAGLQNNGGSRLYLGSGADNSTTNIVIGGKYFTDMLSHVPGVLTASSALITDSSSKLGELNIDNININLNTISTTDVNGNLILSPNGTGKVSIAGAYTLPRIAGTNGYVLTTDGSGSASWAEAASNLTVSATGPVVATTLNNTVTISMAAATASVNGYMTSTFAAKLDGIATGATANTGTVTSVALSGGTTGLTVTGGPITGSGTLTISGILAVANGGSGTNTSTGTGNLVLANNPVLVTPDLGTPSALVLTNATALPLSSITGFASGISAFLATPTSANLISALTTKTGTGLAVFATSPTISTSIITDTSSFNLLNTVATDINFGGAATGLISIGAAAGSTNIKSGLVIDGTTTIKSDLSPNVTEVTNLGGSSKRFNNLYLKNSIDFAGSGSITTNGSGKIVLSGIENTPIGATTASTGAFTTLNVSSNAVISGNLTVNGTLTSISTTNLEISDKAIELGKTASPTEITANGSGIFTVGTSTHSFLYDSSSLSWKSTEHVNLSSGKVYAIDGVSVLEATTLGATVLASSLTSVGILTSGTWSATNIALNKGGTNASLTAVAGAVTYSSGSAMAFTAAGTSGQFLISNGTDSPSWSSTIDGGTY